MTSARDLHAAKGDEAAARAGSGEGHPLQRLGPDDLDMIAEFVVASGSIKEMARLYGVSYPTMRSRLDGLIDRVRSALEDAEYDPLTTYLAELIEGGKVAPEVARRIRTLHRTAIAETRAP